MLQRHAHVCGWAAVQPCQQWLRQLCLWPLAVSCMACCAGWRSCAVAGLGVGSLQSACAALRSDTGAGHAVPASASSPDMLCSRVPVSSVFVCFYISSYLSFDSFDCVVLKSLVRL